MEALGVCDNCRQNKVVKNIGESNVQVCEECLFEISSSLGAKEYGRKIQLYTEEYSLPDVLNKEYLTEELREHHRRIHEAWFFMKTPLYEILHYLVVSEMERLGEDISIICFGELWDLYSKRKTLASPYYNNI